MSGLKLFSRLWGSVAAVALILGTSTAQAHDLRVALVELERNAARISKTLDRLLASPALPPPPRTPDDHRRILGAAEVELALHHDARALQMLVGRIGDPTFQRLPEYVDALLAASTLLEASGEDVGAMQYSRDALVRGGTPEQMAEAGARWFRLARRHQRLSGRLAVFELWKARGGADAAGTELAASAAFEAAFALRADGRFAETQALLGTVPSSSAFGSRAAYLSGVSFVEAGDLNSAERWFTAVANWPVPTQLAGKVQGPIEAEIRELATIAAARLRYERGDLDGADEMYRQIETSSTRLGEVCFERAFLDMERGRHRGALMRLQCVEDVGVGGERAVDVVLLRASVEANAGSYETSLAAYERAHWSLSRSAEVVARAVASISHPGQFMFEAMERNSLTLGAKATPGPATLFADAWTPVLDRAYAVDQTLTEADGTVASLAGDVQGMIDHIAGPDAFPALEMRRTHLRMLLRDIQHLVGHALDLHMALGRGHAALGPMAMAPDVADVAKGKMISDDLRRYARFVEAEMVELDRSEDRRRSAAQATLRSIAAELRGLADESKGIRDEAAPLTDTVAMEALGSIVGALRKGSVRAEVGIIDTYWLRKQHLTRRIRALGEEKDAMDAAFATALRDLEAETTRD